MWDADYLVVLAAIVKEAEQDPVINPKGLNVPVDENNMPWLWRKDHMFTKGLAEFLFLEMRSRYWQWWYWCDYSNVPEIPESSATIFVFCVIQWFVHGGGKDPMLFSEMTIYPRHPQRWSIGRAPHVLAGSILLSGCVATKPMSLREHYRRERRTAQVELWTMNRYKSNFLIDDESMEVLRKT